MFYSIIRSDFFSIAVKVITLNLFYFACNLQAWGVTEYMQWDYIIGIQKKA